MRIKTLLHAQSIRLSMMKAVKSWTDAAFARSDASFFLAAGEANWPAPWKYGMVKIIYWNRTRNSKLSVLPHQLNNN